MADIDQRNYLPIINDFVIVPGIRDDENVRLPIQDALSAISGSSVLIKPFKDKQERMFVLPDFNSGSGYPSDHYATLRTTARNLTPLAT